MSVSTAFPTYPLSSLPSLPPTWEDTSWHNDTCPSWCVGKEVYVYVDFPVASDREFPECSRFSVMDMASDTQLYHGDDWEEVIRITSAI